MQIPNGANVTIIRNFEHVENYYESAEPRRGAADADEAKVVDALLPFFYGDSAEVCMFIDKIRGAKPVQVVSVVNELLVARKISDASCNKPLWEVLYSNGFYGKKLNNWNDQICIPKK